MNHSHQEPEDPSHLAKTTWLIILAVAGVGGSLVISCLTPFVALAVALAGTVRLTIALRAMIAIWLTNQIIGFAFLNFPRTSNSLAWGLAGGAGALLATVVAAMAMQRTTTLSRATRLTVAAALSFAAYELGLFVAAVPLHGLDTFAPAIVAEIGLVNAAWLVGLAGLNELVALALKPLLGVTPRLARP